jgi:hypothetical protein
MSSLLNLTQARAKARALVGAACCGSAMGLALFAAAQMGQSNTIAPPASAPTAIETADLSATSSAKPAVEAAVPVQPQVIQASILPHFTVPSATLRAIDPFRGSKKPQSGSAPRTWSA